MGVTHLDFIIATHAHQDHIGGMPQIAYHFVDKRTKYYYKKFRISSYNNDAYYKAAYNSMKKKGAQLIDVTDKKYEFDFEDMHFELINTDIHKKEEKRGENQNCIGTLITYKNKRYGLVDASYAYSGERDIVEWAGKGGVKDPDKSVQAVVNYLNYLGVTHLDFIIATHAHPDHIGGMPQIAYHFVDKRTKYYYKKFRISIYKNDAYYKKVYNSMKKKGAQLIDVTGKKYEFDFEDMHFELLNTDIHKKEEKRGENQNCIGTLITYKNKRIFLAADLEITEDLKYKDYIGKIDALKMAHHGGSYSSFEFLNATRPKYTIITNRKVPNFAIIPINILQQMFGGKVYYVGGVSTTSKDVATSAIKLYIYEKLFENSKKNNISCI